MLSVSFARRATALSSAMPAPAPSNNISFDSGHAYPGVLPDLTHESEAALTRFRTETLQYAPRAGLPELRKWITEYLAADGVRVPVETVLVTNGAKHAIELVCRALIDEGDSVVVTRPTYFSAIPIIRSYGATFFEIGQDENGMDVGELASLLARLASERRPMPKFIYNISDFHNPTGLTMSLERRQALIDLAVRYQITIVDDSPYRNVRFETDPIPPLKALDRHDCVVHLGTFSKLLAPGLRVGWAAGAPALIARMTQLKTDAGSCPLTQRVILGFCTAGRLVDHITRVQDTYRSHRDRMVAAFRRELPEVSFHVPHGGYYLWLTLGDGIDGDELTRCAGDAGVTIIAGSKFFAPTDVEHPKNLARVAFSHASIDEIDEGVRRLTTAYSTVATGRVVMSKASG
jgi:2-aminoadipate transaminase